MEKEIALAFFHCASAPDSFVTCPFGRALELILAEAGIAYKRIIVDPADAEKSVGSSVFHEMKAGLGEVTDTTAAKGSHTFLPLPALRVGTKWLRGNGKFANGCPAKDVVDDLLRQAIGITGSHAAKLDRLYAATPDSVRHASSSATLSLCGWSYICAKEGSSEASHALRDLDASLRPWESLMRSRCESAGGPSRIVRGWGKWSLGDCLFASHIYTLQLSLRRLRAVRCWAEVSSHFSVSRLACKR